MTVDARHMPPRAEAAFRLVETLSVASTRAHGFSITRPITGALSRSPSPTRSGGCYSNSPCSPMREFPRRGGLAAQGLRSDGRY
jgi:hypothetical protein